MIYDTDTIEIYDGMERIVTYSRSYAGHGYTTIVEHMPTNHQAYHEQRGWTVEYFLQQAAQIGPCTKHYFQGIIECRPVKEQAYNALRGLLRLSANQEVGPQRTEAACKRALRGARFNYATIDNILKNKQDQLEQSDQQVDLFTPPPHDNIRGPQAYE